MIKVRFENIGERVEDRQTFDAELPEFDGQEIIKALKRAKVLHSEPDVWYNKHHGIVYTGGRKPVGTFRII